MKTKSEEKVILKYVCPVCSETFMTLNALKGHTESQHGMESEDKGWGMENYPNPIGTAFIECEEMKCVGCGICQMACSMKHFGVINKELARIQVRKYLLPLPKAVQVTCVQCFDEERERLYRLAHVPKVGQRLFQGHDRLCLFFLKPVLKRLFLVGPPLAHSLQDLFLAAPAQA